MHAVEPADTDLALELYKRTRGLDAFDALLAATALNRGIDTVLSADLAFDELAEIERVDPADGDAVQRLAG